MGCIKLDILEKSFVPMKVVYSSSDVEQKSVQRFLSVDPLWEKFPGMSPYSYCGGEPVNSFDPYGLFKCEQGDQELMDMGISKLAITRFRTMLKHMDSFLDDAKVNELCDMTGMTKDAIKNAFKDGCGPNIVVSNGEMRSEGNQIYISPQALKDLGNVEYSKCERHVSLFAKEVFTIAMFICHEFGHYGDQRTNKGYNTGQFNPITHQNYADMDWGKDNHVKVKPKGSQKRGMTTTGHRGDDVTSLFNAYVVADFRNGLKLTNTSNGSPYFKVPYFQVNGQMSKIKFLQQVGLNK